MEEIVIEVRCHGCDRLIATPAEADMELFRLGIHVHDDRDCRWQLEARIEASNQERIREVRREHHCASCGGTN